MTVVTWRSDIWIALEYLVSEVMPDYRLAIAKSGASASGLVTTRLTGGNDLISVSDITPPI